MYIIERLGPQHRMMPPDTRVIYDIVTPSLRKGNRIIHETDIN